jgi:hypothetical protein
MKGPQSPCRQTATCELATFAAETPNHQIPSDVLQRVKLKPNGGILLRRVMSAVGTSRRFAVPQ